MTTPFFTSDTHFYHHNILVKYNPHSRSGRDANEMTELMILAWNAKVGPDDVVYHLGDVSFADEQKTAGVLFRLNGTIHLIKGNHDKSALSTTCRKRFATITPYERINVAGQAVVLFHYPIYEWDQMHRGAFHLYGHVHGRKTVPGRAMDVGVDTRPNKDMAPYSWDEVHAILIKREIREH